MSAEATPNLSLPYIAAAQAQKHVTHNEALAGLDAVVQLAVLDRDLANPPASPVEGARYIIAMSPAGAWTGLAGQIAVFRDGGWSFHAPREGWLAWVADEDRLVVHDGSGWVVHSSGLQSVNPVALAGINATADAANRLSVKSDGALFSHDDATPGSGDMRLVCNKAAPARTASLLFQSGFSGRAEIGLAGDDNLHVKVSANGTSWAEALSITAATGAVTLPQAVFSATPRPGTDNAMSLGTSGARWSTVYAATGTINTSDARLKTDVMACPLGLDFVRALAPRQFRWREGGADGAPGKRWHTGLIAQEVQRELKARSIDSGMWVLADPSDPESLQSLRYDQLIAPMIAAIQELAARIDGLGGAVRPGDQ